MVYGTVLPQAKKKTVLRLDDFTGGLGGFDYEPGKYYWGQYLWPVRHGYVSGSDGSANVEFTLPMIALGPAASEKTVRDIMVGTTYWRITTSKCYTSTTVGQPKIWTQVSDAATWPGGTPNPTDICAFQVSGGQPVVVVCFGTGTKWYYTVDNGTTWAANTMTGNAAYANYMTMATRGGTAPKVWWVRNPNELYSSFDPSGSTFAGPSLVGDYVNDEHNSLVEDDMGTLLIGKRRILWTIDSLGNTYPLAGPFPYKATRALGAIDATYPTQPGNANFQCFASVEGRVYYVVDDYHILEYDHGRITLDVQPSSFGSALLLRLPVVAMCSGSQAPWLMIALSDGGTSLLNATGWRGGTGLLGNTAQTSTTFIYAGRRNSDGSWTWHGSVNKLAQISRYMSYDEGARILCVANAATTSGQGVETKVVGLPAYGSEGGFGSSVWQIETGVIPAHGRLIGIRGAGYGGSGGITIKYRIVRDEVNDGYTTLITAANTSYLTSGWKFPPGSTTEGFRLQLSGTTNGATALHWADVEFEP